MRILSYYPMHILKIIFEFESGYRIWDITKSDNTGNQLVEEVVNESKFFMSVQLDNKTEEIFWGNGLRIRSSTIYEDSEDLTELLMSKNRNKSMVTPLKITKYNGIPRIVRENEAFLEMIRTRK